MYHFSNQPFYQHDAYQQCSIYGDQAKIQTVPAAPNSKHEAVTIQNVPTTITVLPENAHGALADQANQKNNNKVTNKSTVDTSNFSIEQRLVAAVWVHERKRTKITMSQIKHDFRQRFGLEPPAKNTFLVWERKLFSTGSVSDAPRVGRPIKRMARAAEVAASLRTAPTLPLRARARALAVPRSTLRALLQDAAQSPRVISSGKQQMKPRPEKHIVRKGQAQASIPAQPPALPSPYAPLAMRTHGYT